MPQSDSESISENELNNLIELQGFSSNFRIRLLEAIATKLIEIFEKSNTFFQSGDLHKGGMLANKAMSMYNFYIVRLKQFIAPIDDYRGAMYYECVNSLDVVKNSGEKNLAEMTNSVLKKENELSS